MYCRIFCCNLAGLSVELATVEVDVQPGIPAFEMCGVLATEVREAKERVYVALKNSGFLVRPQKITVNIAPASEHKSGTGFDLPIALGILAASGMIDAALFEKALVAGELGLDGSIRGIRGVLPMLIAARTTLHTAIIPADNMKEAAVIEGINVYGVRSLREAAAYESFHTAHAPHCVLEEGCHRDSSGRKSYSPDRYGDFGEVCGQDAAVRASVIAACGGHNILYIGPPGSGKTMMAKRLCGIMPALSFEDSLEISRIYSVMGLLNAANGMEGGLIRSVPFRAPHHTTTQTALIGGGRIPMPGEITLAHKGILFLDELAEFKSSVLDALRQPMEDKEVTISRVYRTYRYPADFMLVAAMNPCKCGYYPDRGRCRCSEQEVQRYMQHVSRPLMDRFDMSVTVSPVDWKALYPKTRRVSSDDLRERVKAVQELQKRRNDNKLNSHLTNEECQKICYLGTKEMTYMDQVFRKLHLTARGYFKILRTARTIADYEGAVEIQCCHIGEAVAYRN